MTEPRFKSHDAIDSHFDGYSVFHRPHFDLSSKLHFLHPLSSHSGNDYRPISSALAVLDFRSSYPSATLRAKIKIKRVYRPEMAKSQPSESMNTDAQYWTDLGIKYEAAYGHDTGLHSAVQRYLNMLPASARILDCGPGTGKPVAKAIADSGRHVHGIDISSGMISLSRKAVPSGTFEVVSMLQYAPTVSYDGAVASLSFFEFSRQEVTAMSHKWMQWLKPGGLLLISTFAAEDCSQVKADNYDADGECATQVEWGFMGDKVLVTLFTRAGWKALLEKAGFEIVHTEEDLFTPPADSDCEPGPRYYIFAKKPLNG